MLLLLVVVILHCMFLYASSSSNVPVIFLPGYLGCTLSVSVDSNDKLPSSCKHADIPIGRDVKKKSVLFDYEFDILHKQCLYDLLTMEYDEKTEMFYDKAGINVDAVDFGGFDGISDSYQPFRKELESWGYVIGKDLFGAPYDFRYMSVSYRIHDKYDEFN